MEMNILIIDDEANNGWKEILKHLFFKNDNVESVIKLNNAEIKRMNYKYAFSRNHKPYRFPDPVDFQ